MFGRRARARERAAAADPATGPGYQDTAVAPRETGRFATRPRRVGRGRAVGAAAVGTLGAGFLALARLVTIVASVIVLLIVAAIALRDLDANGSNSIVKAIHDGANFFASPFNNLFAESGHYKRAITLNWGIAAVVFFLAGWLVASLIRRIGRGGVLAARRAAAV